MGLANRYGVNQKTRQVAPPQVDAGAPMGPKEPRSSVLIKVEEV